MNIRKLLVSLLLACALLTACAAPSAKPAPTVVSAPSATPMSTPTLSVDPPSIGQVIATIPFPLLFAQIGGIGPHAIWYYFEDSGSVVRLDTTTNQFSEEIEIGDPAGTPYGNPKGIAVSGDQVWVTDVTHYAVVRIDPATNKIVDRISLEKVKNPDASSGVEAIDPFGLALDGDTLWVTDFDKSEVLRVDIQTKQVTAIIPHVRYPENVLVAFGAVWAIEHRDNTLVRIDPATNTVVAEIQFPGEPTSPPCGMCLVFVRASADSLWVPLDYGTAVARIDPVANKIVATIDFKTAILDLAIGADDSVWVTAGAVYGCQNAGNFVARIDPKTNTIVGALPLKCATFLGINDGDLWVGTGDPIMKIPAEIVQIKPAQ